MEQESVISQNILQNMSGGVMTIDLKGQIITFNPAAAKILGLKKDEVIGKRFAEIFFEQEGNDEFNQAILDAIYESSTSHNRTVEFNTGKKTISLTLTTSFLKSVQADGSVDRIGVIAVFDDVSELKTLRDAEIRLTEEIKSKHKELQEAYLKMEEGNRNLEAALKKVQLIRVAATVFAIVLFLGIGIVTWNKKLLPAAGKRAASAAQGNTAQRVFKVSPGPVSSSLSMTGSLEPLHIVNITSPFSGKVKEIYFHYGDIVKAGQLLLKMDVAEAEVKYREAKAAYIKSVGHYKEVDRWDKSAEVARAQRSLAKTRLTLESQKKNFEETERLFKKGIVPANEYEGAKQQYSSQQLDLLSAEEEIQAIIEKGNEENKKIARLEMENAEARLKETERQLAMSAITAPVSGVVIMPGGDNDGKIRTMEKGISLQQSELLFSIGDLSGFSVRSRADEVDITKIQQGQKVTVTGDAFAETPLNGKISTISSQASRPKDGAATPSFDISVSVDNLTVEQRKKIFVGMSANLEVIIYEKPDALMVPVSAVQTDGVKRFVTRRNGSGSEKVEVQTGYTNLDSVEILGGLKPGDEIFVGQ